MRSVIGHWAALLATTFLAVAGPLPMRALAESGPTAEFQSLYKQGGEAAKAKDYETAAQALRKAVKLAPDGPSRGFVAYNLACVEALAGRRAESLQALADAVDAGYAEWQHASRDADLRVLRALPEFKRLIARMKEQSVRRRVFEFTRWDNPDLGWASLHRFGPPNDTQLKQLREEFRLRDVIAGQKTEHDKHLALMAWVHGRWRHDGWNPAPSRDALIILREAAAGKQFRCVEYSVTLAQVLQAAGYPARVVGLRRDGVSFGVSKGHVVAEVWNNELRKWVLVDGQNNATWWDGDKLLDAAEVRERFLGGKADRLRIVHHGSPWIRDWKTAAQRQEWIVYFHHLSYSFDNIVLPQGQQRRHVQLIRPGESHELLFQGSPQPRDSQTQDPAQIYPSLNLVHIDLGSTGKEDAISNVLTAQLTNSSPGFDHYVVTENGRSVQHQSNTFGWTLVPGPNSLIVRAVNQAGVAGPPSRIDVTYHPASAANPQRAAAK